MARGDNFDILVVRVKDKRYIHPSAYTRECVSDQLSRNITDASTSRRCCDILLSENEKCSQSAVVLSYCLMYP